MSFDKSCGRFRLTVGPPSPEWVEITTPDDDRCTLKGFDKKDLHDLRYLIDRALNEKV